MIKKIVSFCLAMTLVLTNVSGVLVDATSVTTTTTASSTVTTTVVQQPLKGEEALQSEKVVIVGDSLADCWRGFGHFKHSQVIGRISARVNPKDYPTSWNKLTDVNFGSKKTTYEKALTEAKPETIFVQMGTNDWVGMQYTDKTIETFLTNYKDMIEKFKTYAPSIKNVFVMALPPTVGVDSKLSSDTVQKVNEQLQKLCNDNGYKFVDTFTTLYNKLDNHAKTAYFNEDGIHFNSKGAEAIWEVLKTLDLTVASNDTEQALQNEAQASAENTGVTTENKDSPVAELVNKMNDSQKEIYAITTNKYMTSNEYDCMRFNLIISQFAIPYRQSVQDVLNSTIWKNMATAGDGAGLTISENPYIKVFGDSERVLKDTAIADSIKEIIGETKEYNYKTIYDTMCEENEISYTPVYKGSTVGEGGSHAFVTDLFKGSTETTQTVLYIKDNLAVIGDEALKPTLKEKLQAFNQDYLYGNTMKEGVANNIIASGGEKTEIYFPVFCLTDSTMMYNAIFVNNAIRIGGYGTYDSFIKSVGNSQLYMDRWGNLCAKLKVNGTSQFVIVYPAYANPLFISNEIADTDMAGYAYCDFNQENLFKSLVLSAGSSSSAWKDWTSKVSNAIDKTAQSINGSNGSSATVEIDPQKVAKTYGDVKGYFGKNGWTELNDDVYLGAKDSNSDSGLYKTFYRQVGYYTNSNNERKSFVSGVYSRTNSKYSNEQLIPILGVDTTTNFMYNKAIASAYTRDSYTTVSQSSKSSKDYGSAKDSVLSYYNGVNRNWYDCLQDATSDYTVSLIENYNNSDKSGVFSNSVVLDKYYVSALFKGTVINGAKDNVNHKPIFNVDGSSVVLPNASITAEVRPFIKNSKENSYAISAGINGNSILYKGTESLKITDTSTIAKDSRTLYPFMMMHGYRKGLYLDTPTLQSESKKSINPYLKDGAKVDLFNLIQENKVSPSFNYANIVSGWNELNTSGSILHDLKIPIEVYWNAMYLDSDKFKTYAVFNYPAESLPSNSAMYGIMNYNSNHGTYVNNIYTLGSLFTDSREEGRLYTTVPIMDSVLDFAIDWEIWNDTINADTSIINSAKFTKRDRSIDRYLYTDVSKSALKDKVSLFEPLQLDTSEENRSIASIRWFLNDRRVSDVLENYPIEDVTMLTFVWLNYYIPQTPFDNKVDLQYVSNQLQQTQGSNQTSTNSSSSWESTVKQALAIYCETNPSNYKSGGTPYTYKINGSDYKADACCTTGIHLALKILGQESGLVVNSSSYCNDTTVRSKMEALGFKYKLTSEMTDDDWKNLTIGSLIISDGSDGNMQNHTTMFGGWVAEDTIDKECYLFDTGRLGLGGESNTKLRTNYNYKDGDKEVSPMQTSNYNRKWFKEKMKCVYIAPTSVVNLNAPQTSLTGEYKDISDFFFKTMGIEAGSKWEKEWASNTFKCITPGKDKRYAVGKEHHGVDFCAPEGSPVLTPCDGVVTYTYKDSSAGNIVIIKDSAGYGHVHLHLKDGSVTVKKGDIVKIGQKIAEVGQTGSNGGGIPHVHYQIAKLVNDSWKNNCMYEVDPLTYNWPADSVFNKSANTTITTTSASPLAMVDTVLDSDIFNFQQVSANTIPTETFGKMKKEHLMLILAACEKYHLPASGMISQYILESGWGTSDAAVNKNNFFGIMNSQHKLRTYQTAAQCIEDYAWLISCGLYRKQIAYATNTEEFLKGIQGLGPAKGTMYCADPPGITYVNHNMELVKQYDLTKYDAGWYKGIINDGGGDMPRPFDDISVVTITEAGPKSLTGNANVDNTTTSSTTDNTTSKAGEGTDTLYPADTVLTQSSVVCSSISNPNNTLMYTTNLSEELEKSLTLGGNGGIGVGTAPELVVSTQFIYSVNMNFGLFCLAVNKNTSGDCLTYYVGQIPETHEFDTDTFLDFVEYFFKNPATAILNILLGFAQTVHSAIATGTIGNVFNLTWVIDFLIAKKIFQWYLIVSSIVLSLVLVVRFFTFIWSKERTLKSLMAEILSSIAMVILPIFSLYCINDLLQYVSISSTKEASSKLALVQIESEVSSTENLNLNYEKVYTMFKDQYEGIQDDYGDLAIEIASGINEDGSLTYTESNLRELYDTVEYSNVLSKALVQAELCENGITQNEDSNDNSNDKNSVENLYESADSNIVYTYYNYKEFVPVNYMNYKTSIFYYFYDYLKYQYLSYWANDNSNPNGAFSQAAKQFTLPTVDEDNEELMSSYIDRMWSAEKTMLARSYNGVYLMYRDSDYAFTEEDSINPKDLFGLSYLFNMNSQYNFNQQGYPSDVYLQALKSDNPTLDNWKVLAQTNYNENAGNYGKWIASIKEAQNGTDDVSVLPECYPLAYLMDGYYWNAYTSLTNSLKVDKESDSLDNYTFTPSFLTKSYPDWYSSYPSLNNVSSNESVRNDSSLKVSNLGDKRVYGRVYASKSQLAKHTGSSNNEITELEKKLMHCTTKIYDDILEITGYLQGDVRDSSLIFACALIATYDFNKEFSQTPIIGTQIYPQTLAQDSMDLDKFMRATYATDIDSIVKNTNTLYMISEQNNGGPLTVICIVLTEVILILLLIARLIILTLLLIASAYICTTFWLNPPKLRQDISVGVIAQLLTFVITQISMILVLTSAMNLISNFESNLYRTIASLTMALCMIALLGLNYKMMFALLRDMKHYGGAIINNAITTTLTDIRTRMTAMNNVELKNKIAHLSLSKTEENAVNNRRKNNRVKNSNALDKATNRVQKQKQKQAESVPNKKQVKSNSQTLPKKQLVRRRYRQEPMHSNYNVYYSNPEKIRKMFNKALEDNRKHLRTEKRRYTLHKMQKKNK